METHAVWCNAVGDHIQNSVAHGVGINVKFSAK
jgi:hypothetical protein